MGKMYIHPKRIFKAPEELEAAWMAYLTHLEEIAAKKWLKIQYIGKEGQRVEDEYKLPYTMEGFEVFCWDEFGTVFQYFDNKDGLYDDFVAICSHIRRQIRDNQITGGLLGIYNPSITQRLNSLVDKSEMKADVTQTRIEYVGNAGNDPIQED